MTPHLLRNAASACLAVVIAALAGCGPTHFDDPIARMVNPAEMHSIRWKAAAQAEREMPNDPKRIAALKQLVWAKHQPHEFRNYAIDQLIAHDEADTRRYLNERLMLIDDWRTFDHIAQIAEQRHWVDLTPGLVRRYAIKVNFITDMERPERKLIEKLNPGQSVESVILRVFADPDYARRIETRAAAWALLTRLTPRDRLMTMLRQLPSDEPLVADLQAGARDLHLLVDSMETITWLRLLRTEAYRDFYREAKQVVAQLTAEQQQGLALRHLPVLVHLAKTNDPLLAEPRAQLLSESERFVAGQSHYLKGPTFDGPMDEVPQRLSAWRDKLCWADLVVLRTITRCMGDRAIVASWFTQADRDLRDELSEHGGLLRWNDSGHLAAVPYPPEFRKHDLAYYASKKLILDAYTALAHYHFHAQKHRNIDYAGPGLGDQKRIGAIQQFNGLVLTFINQDQLNVDYYFGPEVIIDLGSVTR